MNTRKDASLTLSESRCGFWKKNFSKMFKKSSHYLHWETRLKINKRKMFKKRFGVNKHLTKRPKNKLLQLKDCIKLQNVKFRNYLDLSPRFRREHLSSEIFVRWSCFGLWSLGQCRGKESLCLSGELDCGKNKPELWSEVKSLSSFSVWFIKLPRLEDSKGTF